MITLDPRHAALVLIDLQNGILAMPTAPRLGPEILKGAKALAARFRAAGAPVVLVRVAFAKDYADAPPSLVDQPMNLPPGGLPEAWSALADGLAEPGDIIVVKRHWGAFNGTDLDLQLRRRAVRDVVIGGIATNIGVELTVRHAWELGYNMIVAEDLCATHSTELHDMSIRHIFPRISRVVASDAVALA